MTYKILSQIHFEDVGEDVPRAPDPILQALERRLKTAIAALQQAKTPMTAPGPSRVAQIKAMHEGLARTTEYEREINDLRGQIARAGGSADDAGNVRLVRGPGIVAYDSTLVQQGLTRVEVVAGVMYDRTGAKLDTATMSTFQKGRGYGIYVMSAQGNLHVTSMELGRRHHSSVLAGAPVAAAGEMKVTGGILEFISNDSGHYQPSGAHFLQIFHHLQKRGVSLDGCEIMFVWGPNPTDWSTYHGVAEFLTDNDLDDDSYDWNNLLYAYRHLLTPLVLGPKGWEYRVPGGGGGITKPAVYRTGTNEMVPHLDVRHFLKHQGTAFTQTTGRPQPLPTA